MITAPGIYTDIDAGNYHADICPEPSLSSSVASTLLDRSAHHAWLQHSRLNPHSNHADLERKRRLQIGSAAHAMLIGRGKQLEILPFSNYAKKEAQQRRDDAIEGGLIPILQDDYHTCSEMVRAARKTLPDVLDDNAFQSDGNGEVVIAWKDPIGPWCRGMIDWLSDSATIYDYKTTDRAIQPDPQTLGRWIADQGYDLQAMFYTRGLEILKPEWAGRIKHRIIRQETEPPYEIVICEMDGTAREMGRRRAAAAIAMWHRYMQAGPDEHNWPGYPQGIVTIEYPMFIAAMQERREMIDERYASIPYDPMTPVLAYPKQLMEPN